MLMTKLIGKTCRWVWSRKRKERTTITQKYVPHRMCDLLPAKQLAVGSIV